MRLQHPAAGPSLTSCLKVVDPETGRSCAEVQFRPLELVRSLATWHIRGQKSYRYVCVGTAQLTEQGDMQDSVQQQQATGGRLVIYNLKPVKRKSRSRLALSPEVDRMAAVSSAGAPGYELKYVWESDRSGPVSALASLGDAYLVVAVGARCVVLKLDVVQKRLIECCECPLRFAAVSLDICGHDIVVGSTREAVNVLRFTAAEGDSGYDKLEPVYSARFGANTADARFLAADLVAGVDHSGFVFVAGLPVKSAEFGLDFALGMHLGTECTRLRVGQMVQRLDLPEHVLAWSRSANDSSDNRSAGCIVISTLSGGMWTIARISDDAFALLRRLELAMLAMPPLHPARPLFAASGSINRARNTSRIQPTGIVDGSLSATFVQHLTTAERIEVVDSSPDLMQAALAVAERSILGPCPAAPDPHTTAAEFVARLVHDLSRVSIC
ncbi:hypothetical protein H4R23_000699 [Coemansia sp. Cherry 401B]|nr:hypothetical protein H4R23_000699 [Coemansia sp. Cherry 401B]